MDWKIEAPEEMEIRKIDGGAGNNTPKKVCGIPENSCKYCVHGQPDSTNRKCLACNNRSEFRRYNNG